MLHFNKIITNKNLVLVNFQDIEGAKDYFKRKVQFVTEQMEKIQMIGMEKSKIREAICMMMEMKLQAQAQAQKPSSS